MTAADFSTDELLTAYDTAVKEGSVGIHTLAIDHDGVLHDRFTYNELRTELKDRLNAFAGATGRLTHISR